MSNPYGAPAQDSDAADAEPWVQRGRTLVIAIALGTTVFDLGVMVALGRVQWPISLRIAVVLGLLYGVYMRRNWARVLLVVLCAFLALTNALQFRLVSDPWWKAVTIAWPVLQVSVAIVLMVSPAINALARQRRRLRPLETLPEEE